MANVGTSAQAATYADVTTAAGITHTQTTTQLMQGGAVAGDFDGDGWVDLFVTRASQTDVLYRNKHDGTFEDISSTSGFSTVISSGGAVAGDLDNDGDLDIYVTAYDARRFYLYINDGTGHFSEQAVARGADIPVPYGSMGQSAAVGDYDRDGYLDIITGDWGYPTSVSASRLLRNMGSANPGHFQDVTAATGINQYPDAYSFRFSPRFADMDNDGLQDIAIAADFTNSQLFWNNGDGTFIEGTVPAGVGTDNNGMGSTIADFDADGDLDWFVTAIYDTDPAFPERTGNRLYVNQGNRTFTDGTDDAGVRDAGWAWGTSFLDYDNDGDLDLVATNGWPDGQFAIDPTTLWQNNDNVFTDVTSTSAISDTSTNKGLLTFDYDNDGDLDLFIVRNQGQPILYRNDGGNSNHWLRILTEGTVSNRDGIGARIMIDPDSSVSGDEQYSFIDGGSNFLSQNQMMAHFGLGSATTIDNVTITWPSGIVQQFFNVSADTILAVVETELPGDLNGDAFVGLDDLDIILAHWNQNVTPGLRLMGDPDADGYVGLDDLDLVIGHWNTGTPPPANTNIPEPTSLLLTALGLALISRRH